MSGEAVKKVVEWLDSFEAFVIGVGNMLEGLDKRLTILEGRYDQSVLPTNVVTAWRDSTNKSIEWCPEQEADPEDVKKAMAKEDDMWYLPPRNGYTHGSIFRRKPQK